MMKKMQCLQYFLDELYLNVELDATDEDGYKANDFFRVNYCPMCGRKLGD